MKFGNIIKRQKREENKEELTQEMWVPSLYNTKLEYLSSIVFHTVILKIS